MQVSEDVPHGNEPRRILQFWRRFAHLAQQSFEVVAGLIRSIPSAGVFRSLSDMRAPHSSPCAKICCATTSSPPK
jgi:hypothetical protein